MRMSPWKYVAAAALVAFSALQSLAADLPAGQAGTVWVAAWGQTHKLHRGDRDLLNNPPVVYLVPRATLCGYHDREPDCRLMGTVDAEGKVFLADDIPFGHVYGASIVYHEFIHVIQFRMWGPVKDCRDHNRREKMAHEMHAQILLGAHEPVLAEMVMKSYTPLVCI